jgi:hypothetical protein
MRIEQPRADLAASSDASRQLHDLVAKCGLFRALLRSRRHGRPRRAEQAVEDHDVFRDAHRRERPDPIPLRVRRVELAGPTVTEPALGVPDPNEAILKLWIVSEADRARGRLARLGLFLAREDVRRHVGKVEQVACF